MTVRDAAELTDYWVDSPPPHELLGVMARGMVWKAPEGASDAPRPASASGSTGVTVTRHGDQETRRGTIWFCSSTPEEQDKFFNEMGLSGSRVVVKKGG